MLKDLLIDNNSIINRYIMNFLSINFCTELGSIFVKTRDNTFNKDLQIDKTNNDFIMNAVSAHASIKFTRASIPVGTKVTITALKS